MKTRSLMKSVLAAMMVFVMTVCCMAPAFAADDNKIVIQSNGQQGIGPADRFQAYCIFTGTLGAQVEELSNLSWGHGIDSDALVAAMKADETVMADGRQFGQVFTEEWTAWNADESKQYDEAVFVARFLAKSDHVNDPAYADDFARLVAAHLKPLNDGVATPGASEDNLKFNPYKSTVGPDGNWTITVPHSGYYLVVDTYKGGTGEEPAPDGAASSYILEVIGHVTVVLKATVPTVEKKVEGMDGYMAGTYEDLNYTLTGTVSENINEYTTYAYKFTDNLTSGLTINKSSVAVKLTATGIDEKVFTIDTDYHVALAPDDTSNTSHVLTVSFDNLKQSIERVAGTLDLSSTDIVNSIKIIVSYKAKMNEHAVMGAEGNPNDVFITYSNNPYEEGQGDTVKDEVQVYTVALQIKKIDETGTVMPNIKFKLRNADGQFAVLTQTTETTNGHANENCYTITGWAAGNVQTAGTEMTTDESGIINIHGLDIGEYTLVETATKKDYELMKSITFEVTSDQDGPGYVDEFGAMGAVTLVEGYDNARDDVELTSSGFNAHNAQMTLTNYPSPILPHTGGIGRTIVLIVSGIAVLAGAAVIFVVLRKKGSNKT